MFCVVFVCGVVACVCCVVVVVWGSVCVLFVCGCVGVVCVGLVLLVLMRVLSLLRFAVWLDFCFMGCCCSCACAWCFGLCVLVLNVCFLNVFCGLLALFVRVCLV